jgi:hypothetical protein
MWNFLCVYLGALERGDACPPSCLIPSYWGCVFDLLYVDVSLNCLSSFKCIMVSDLST